MKASYLTGVNRKPSSFTNIIILGSGTDVWYAGSYNDVKSNHSTKKEIVRLTNGITGQDTSPYDWDWHHVVETQHMSYIINGNLHQEEWHSMPTILISKNEHHYLSQNYNNNAFRELTNIAQGRKIQERSNSDSDKEKRVAKIESLKMMYNNAYLSHPTLRKIANNVFNYHLNLLRN